MSLPPPAIFSGNIVHSLDYKTLEIIPHGIIGVSRTGTILFVERDMTPSEAITKNAGKLFELEKYDINSTSNPETEIQVHEFGKNEFLFPGFIDTHVHASQYPNVGIFGETTLLDWLDKYTFPLESTFKDPQHGREVYKYAVGRTLANGTTLASYYGTIHIDATVELAKICERLGQRALVGRVCMERHCPKSLIDEDPVKKDREFIEKVRALKSDLVSPIITPRFAASCTAETLAAQGKLAEELDVPVQTHLNENDKEIEWMKELFPESEHYTDIYDRAGLLRKGAIYAHCIHMTEPERKLFKERGCGISHCPISNSSLGSGIAPVLHLLEEGQKVSIGTDMSGGFSPSVLVNTRQAIMMSRELARATQDDSHKLKIENGLYLATLGGAETCNRGQELGNFVVGKKFDAQLIDVSAPGTQIDIFEWNTPQDPKERIEYLATKWVYIGDDRNTTKVWVSGQLTLDKSA